MNNDQKKHKIAIITTLGQSLDVLYPDFYPLLIDSGFDIVGICSFDGFEQNVSKQGVRVVNIPMARTVNPLSDIICFIKMYNLFRKEKFDIINYSTAKASVLAAIAGKFARTSKLIYTMRGTLYPSMTGVKRFLAKFSEKIIMGCADYIIAISPSLMQSAISDGMTKPNKIEVFGSGSSKGVNTEIFQPNSENISKGCEIRKKLGILDNDIVIGYVGRLATEKGIYELYDAFKDLKKDYSNIHLLIVGDQDGRCPIDNKIFNEIKSDKCIHMVGRMPYNSMNIYYAAMDIFVLASYREGFGNVIIEASAMSKPVITTNIVGCKDAVKDGITGILVNVRDSNSIRFALDKLIKNSDLRISMGNNGRQWIVKDFDRKNIWRQLIDVYKRMLNNN